MVFGCVVVEIQMPKNEVSESSHISRFLFEYGNIKIICGKSLVVNTTKRAYAAKAKKFFIMYSSGVPSISMGRVMQQYFLILFLMFGQQCLFRDQNHELIWYFLHTIPFVIKGQRFELKRYETIIKMKEIFSS